MCKLNVILVGGAGARSASSFNLKPGIQKTVNFAYIDFTDESAAIPFKINKTIVDTNDGVSGSGGIRTKNLATTLDQVKYLLTDLNVESTDITILIGGTNGGSGSMLLNAVAGELMSQGNAVLAFTIRIKRMPYLESTDLSSI